MSKKFEQDHQSYASNNVPNIPPPGYNSNRYGNPANYGQNYGNQSQIPPPSAPLPEPAIQHQINAGNNTETQSLRSNLELGINRNSFIAKVYAILGVQLLVSFVPVVCVSLINKEEVKNWVNSNSGTIQALLWTAIVLQFVILFGMSCCCVGISKKTPWNYLLLGAFTICEAFLLSIIVLYFDTNIVLIAVAGTAAITILVSLFSAFTKFDFTKAIHVMGIILLVWCLLSWFFVIFNWNDVVYGLIGCSIFTVYLAIDTQLIIGGKRYEFDEEDYIFAALNLYLDIINIFLYLLRLIQGASD